MQYACIYVLMVGCVFLSFQMIWFRENWYEELLRQLNEGLSLCQAAAFASRADGRLTTSNMKSHPSSYYYT